MVKKETKAKKILSENTFPVVGVGASAGGLEAFKALIKGIKEDSGMAYILVQHLAPQYDSMLTEILQKSTNLPVEEIKDNVEVKPDHIYIIPSNKLLVANDGVLQLSPRIKGEKLNTIDIFFNSLAEIHQAHAIGVVLSGTGNDGTLGLKAIRDHGGITIAQDEHSAAYYGMPQSAINAEVVDFVLAPANIPLQITELLEGSDVGRKRKANRAAPSSEISDILSILRIKKNVDFMHYKRTTLNRRIVRRKALNKQPTLEAYKNYLAENKPEQDALLSDLLIQVTSFFRDPQTFAFISEKIIPSLFKDNADKNAVRVWIAGCSTGQEAYSVAICICEFLDANNIEKQVQIFATDISEPAIAKARSGAYLKKEMTGLSEARINQYFTLTNGSYHVHKRIRDMCVFACQNFLKDPPFVKMNLLLCRNVLIYMEAYLQQKALLTFHYALLPSGFLVLGKSETIGHLFDGFTTFSQQNKIFVRKPISGKVLPLPTHQKNNLSFDVVASASGPIPVKDILQKAADDALLRSYATAGVIVDKNFDILQFRGSTGPYLEAPPGRVSNNLMKMARNGLSFELRKSFKEVLATNEIVIKKGILLDEGKRQIELEIIPLAQAVGAYFLVVFKEGEPIPGLSKPSKKGRTKAALGKLDREADRIAQLEKELKQAREDLRIVTEDHEAANQELQSANEDLLSGSEELQSLNEELETTKEEVQSTNQELTVLNQELIERNEQLMNSRKYAEAVVTTIHEPLVILTADFRIKSVNKNFLDNFNDPQEQIDGRLLFEIGNGKWNVAGLRENLEKILPDHEYFSHFEMRYKTASGNNRILMLNGRQLLNDNNSEQLILLAIRDITVEAAHIRDQKLFAEELESQVLERTRQLKEANTNLQYSNENLEQFASIASHDLQEPLRKIKTFTSLLSKRFAGDVPEEAKEIIVKIRSATERMSQLIKEVLEYSRTVRSIKDFVATDLNLLLKNVLMDLSLLIAETGAEINCMDHFPSIEAIPLQMNQLFYNLLTNGLKFTKKDSPPFISINWRALDAEEIKSYPELDEGVSYIEITVTDTGIGFKQQFGKQIFLIFERLHSVSRFEGTGIGLALCKKIVENHHGHIFSKSEEGIGSSFHAILPLKQRLFNNSGTFQQENTRHDRLY